MEQQATETGARLHEIANFQALRDIILTRFPPHDERPIFDIPRFWSNAALNDPERIIAGVLAKPSMADLAKTIHAYGPDRVAAGLFEMMSDEDVPRERINYTCRLVRLAMEGVADAARKLTSS